MQSGVLAVTQQDKASDRVFDAVVSVVLALALPAPAPPGIVPNAIILWLVVTGSTGEVPPLWALIFFVLIIAIYATVVYLVIRFLKYKLRTLRRKKSQ